MYRDLQRRAGPWSNGQHRRLGGDYEKYCISEVHPKMLKLSYIYDVINKIKIFDSWKLLKTTSAAQQL